MFVRDRQKSNDFYSYSDDQVRRSLLACGIEIESEIDQDYIIFCPYHSNYRTPAGEVSKTTGQFYCFGCQESKNLIELVMFYSKRTFFEASRLIESKRSVTNISDDIDKLLRPVEEVKPFDMQVVDRLNMEALKSSRAASYLKGRGINKSSVEKYKIGYSEVQDMITIPVYSPSNICVGMVGRSIEGKTFKNTPNLPRNQTLFNLSRNKRSDNIFVVESSFDAIRIEQVGGNAVATLGATVSTKQKDLLKKYFNSIIVLSDNDTAGQGMKDKLIASLGSKVIAPDLPESVKDVSDMDDQSLKDFIAAFDDVLMYMLR